MASYALVAVGLNIVIGYAGLLDLGYVGFYAIGAYTTGVLTSQHWHWPFFLALPVAIAVTMVTGVILGAPTLRVRGDYLAIVTLGFGEIIRITITQHRLAGCLGRHQGHPVAAERRARPDRHRRGRPVPDPAPGVARADRR